MPLYAVVERPGIFALRSGLTPLAEALKANTCLYEACWEKLARKSWRLGHWARTWGQHYYRSEWNSLLPLWHDLWMRRVIPRGRSLVHFLFAEFAAPRDSGFLRRRGAIVIATFHCSARRQERVHGAYPLANFDWISVVSASQIPFFIRKGFPEDRIRLTRHGVDTEYFRPPADRKPAEDGLLRLLLVGSTERDHEFMASVCRKLPPDRFAVDILTQQVNHPPYRGIPCVRLAGHLPDADLLKRYQSADLLVMPMLDCTANNAILEAMACGTPVMTNRIGGTPEYVSPECSILLAGKNPDEWVDRLTGFRQERNLWSARRMDVRRWAEGFSWTRVAEDFKALYSDALREVEC